MDGGRRVLVTRPQPGAGATARRLLAAGFQPVVLPLSRTEPLPAALPEQAHFDAVAATSAQAVRWASPSLLEAIRGKPFLAVGARTGLAARKAGFSSMSEGEGDAAALARLVLSRPELKNVLYLCGRVRRPDFEATLRARGVAVLPIETYDTQEIVPSARRVAGAFAGEAVAAVLLFSEKAAWAYRQLREDPAARPFLAEAAAFALSPRILGALPPEQKGFAAAQPNEEALFALLAELSPGAASFQPSPV